MKQKWKEKAACPYKLARVAYLSMPKAMCVSGIRGGKSVCGVKGGKCAGAVGCQVPFSIFFCITHPRVFLGGGTGVCALTGTIQDIPKE